MAQRSTQLVKISAAIILSVFMTACPKLAVQHVDQFPADRFTAALSGLDALENRRLAGDRNADEICLLVYDGESHELVDMRIPLVLLTWGMDVAIDDSGEEGGIKAGGTVVCDQWRMLPEDLEALGPGLLVQVDDEQEGTHVLIWLE